MNLYNIISGCKTDCFLTTAKKNIVLKSLCQDYQSTAPLAAQLVGQKLSNKFTRFDNIYNSYEITLQLLLYMFIGCSFAFSVAVVKCI